MTKELPDFVKRVKEKFMPHIYTTKPDGYGVLLQMYLTKEYEIEKLIAMGGTLAEKNDDDNARYLYGRTEGKLIKWVPYYYDPSYECLTFKSHTLRQNEYKYHVAIDLLSRHILEFNEYGAAGKAIEDLFGIKEWQNCHKYYSQKYEARKKTFEAKNPIWQQLVALDKPEVKAAMSENEQKAMRNLYESKLKKDPDYRGLQVLKQDVFDLATYVKYLEKQEKKGKREELKGKLENLTEEYNSDDVKEALPDQKVRLAVRGIMHKNAKRESGL